MRFALPPQHERMRANRMRPTAMPIHAWSLETSCRANIAGPFRTCNNEFAYRDIHSGEDHAYAAPVRGHIESSTNATHGIDHDARDGRTERLTTAEEALQ
jgi:hypothetical protein